MVGAPDRACVYPTSGAVVGVVVEGGKAKGSGLGRGVVGSPTAAGDNVLPARFAATLPSRAVPPPTENDPRKAIAKSERPEVRSRGSKASDVHASAAD